MSSLTCTVLRFSCHVHSLYILHVLYCCVFALYILVLYCHSPEEPKFHYGVYKFNIRMTIKPTCLDWTWICCCYTHDYSHNFGLWTRMYFIKAVIIIKWKWKTVITASLVFDRWDFRGFSRHAMRVSWSSFLLCANSAIWCVIVVWKSQPWSR